MNSERALEPAVGFQPRPSVAATFDFRVGSFKRNSGASVAGPSFNTAVAETSTITMPMGSEQFSQHLLTATNRSRLISLMS